MAKLYKPKPKAGSDDLEILHPDLCISIQDEQWTLREYGFVEAARLAEVGQRVAQSIESGMPEIPDLISLLALATGQDAVRIGGIDSEGFERLVSAWRRLNSPIFLPDDVSTQRGTPPRWGDVYAMLIAHGHDSDRIGRYTGRQVKLHYDCAQRRERRQRAHLISAVNLAFAGGNKAAEVVNKLQSE